MEGSANIRDVSRYFKGTGMRWHRVVRWDWLVLLAAFLGGVLLARCSHAAALPLTLPANVGLTGSGHVTKIAGVGVEFAGAAFNSGLTTQVAGKAVTVPAAWRLASNAGQIASAAIRVNPTWATAALLTWLVSYGLEKCADGSWCKRESSSDVGACYDWSGGGGAGQYRACTAQRMYDIAVQLYGGSFTFNPTPECSGPQPPAYGTVCKIKATNHATFNVPFNYGGPATEELKPSTDADWNAVAAGTTPDWVYSWLANKGIGLPLNPQVNPATQTVPLSDPYVDPVTGKRYKDVAYVTPRPSSPTTTAELQVAKQEVDADGNPIVDPNTGGAKAPEETDDPCLAHPDRLGCMEKGEIPEGPDLEADERTITITPDSGWGADTMACPADLTATYLGRPIAFSFKPVCDGADMFRPVVIGMAWVAAVLIALGVGRKGD